jgi:hypothetical protein
VVFPVAVKTGALFTFTVTVPELSQPFASVPITVYVVVVAGCSTREAPVALPGCHT